jgi:hypothetical protein
MHRKNRSTAWRRPAYYSEDRRIETRRGRLFQTLTDGQWHDAEELAGVGGISFHASLHQFRRAGWRVESQRVGRKWRYRVTGRVEGREIC